MQESMTIAPTKINGSYTYDNNIMTNPAIIRPFLIFLALLTDIVNISQNIDLTIKSHQLSF